MTQAVIAITREHVLALEILVTAEKIQKAPMRRDLQTYYEELLLNHYEPLVRGRLEQNRENRVNFARQHGQQRVHSEQRPISEKKVKQIAYEDMLESLDRIKLWLSQNPRENFQNQQALIEAAVADFEKFREK